MDRFRAAIDEIFDKVKEAINGEPKSPVEILLDQHLSLDEGVVSFSPKNCTAVAIPTGAMNDFAARTKNIVDYPFIMERIWEILIDHQHDPTLMKKALNLLLFLLVNGAIQAYKDSQESIRMRFLQNLTEDYNRYEFEQYKFSQHLDVGAGVRKTAAEILELLTNERQLLHARHEAEKLHRKLSNRGLRSQSSSSLQTPQASQLMQGHFSSQMDVRPPRYTDTSNSDDMGLKIVTHPDELFDATLTRSESTRAPSPLDSIDRDPGANDYHDKAPKSTRGHTRKEMGNGRSRRDRREATQASSSGSIGELTAESVDLLGLEALGLESLSPMSSRLEQPPPATSRTQSARPGQPQQYTATI